MNQLAIPPIQPAHSLLEQLHDPYFTQKVPVSRQLVGMDRVSALVQLCAGRRVLHVGCVDSPIFDPANNLHLQLLRSGQCARLVGVDLDAAGIAELGKHCDQPLYATLADVNEPFDVVLVPEVIEHVGNLAMFLEELDRIDFTNIIITVPDAVQCHTNHFDFSERDEMFVEVVHPDHNYWFSPYTLLNVVKKYTSWHPKGMFFFNKISLLMIASKRAPE
ncbi:hypothetical protein AWB67_06062 [Caballeronia terrestris]|jgi:hypothetical protein|uniref:Bifunctional 3-demethylubiquinone-9 3-methyltransferase/ 2-octaprenyl-6-hydroxy phenol methylase n=1 Tax=Caballeronia terrestris TaxID=1226301 RepID=A0A158KM57_9BURK|nr:hypothetical protein [Caballeronia terrestris]SAL82217.1 hypothetical protein AWB67_06062 [Caballeronia terrestris]